jgi:hypothetical protein
VKNEANQEKTEEQQVPQLQAEAPKVGPKTEDVKAQAEPAEEKLTLDKIAQKLLDGRKVGGFRLITAKKAVASDVTFLFRGLEAALVGDLRDNPVEPASHHGSSPTKCMAFPANRCWSTIINASLSTSAFYDVSGNAAKLNRRDHVGGSGGLEVVAIVGRRDGSRSCALAKPF